MAIPTARRIPTLFRRTKTTSSQYVSSRYLDPTFEKLMDNYKHLFKVLSVIDLVLSSPSSSLPLPVLSALSQRLHLNRGPTHFLRSFPHVFDLSPAPRPLVRLTPAAAAISSSASSAASPSEAAARVLRLLSISSSKSLPLRALLRVSGELGLPDDFEQSVISRNSEVFQLRPNPAEPNTHVVHLIAAHEDIGRLHFDKTPNFTLAIDDWRRVEGDREVFEGRAGSRAPEIPLAIEAENKAPIFSPAVNEWRQGNKELEFAFKQSFPPGMKLSKNFRAKVKEWQGLPYMGPYEGECVMSARKRRSKAGIRALEKRAVAIVHEFLSLTVEKMVEVEKISHFRKWFGIELNIRDLFLDHPGMFYLSTKGYRHTVFLREGYEKGRLIDRNPTYDAKMQLLELVMLRRKGIGRAEDEQRIPLGVEEEEMEVRSSYSDYDGDEF